MYTTHVPIRTIRVALLLALLLITAPARAADTIPRTQLATDHYDLYVEQLNAPETGRMLEELYKQLATLFGKTPPTDHLLKVAIYATRTGYIKALDDDHQVEPTNSAATSAGGYYAPGNRKAYLFIQPSDYFTRQLILHECVHQCHLQATCGNRVVNSIFYVEGIADYLGMHNWDGQHLRIGVIPTITLEDYPAKALESFVKKHDRNLEDIVSGKIPLDRSVDTMLLHFIADTWPKKFAAWRNAMDHNADPIESWNKELAPLTADTAKQFETWLKAHQEPWQIETISWQPFGQSIEGKTADNCVAISLLKQTPKTLTVEIEPQADRVMAGLTFGHRSKEDYWIMQVQFDGSLRLIEMKSGKWQQQIALKAPARKGPLTFSVTQKNDASIVSANGVELRTVQATGQVGLNIQFGKARFRIIEPKTSTTKPVD